MADNTAITPGAGESIRDKDRAGVKTQVVGIDVGIGTGTESLMSASAPMPTYDPDVTASGSLTAAAQTVVLVLNGSGAASFQITGTWVGTIAFEATVDGTTWVPVNSVVAGASVPVQTTSANGLYRLTPAGLTQVRANMSAFTSGTAVISARASSANNGVFANQIVPVAISDGTTSTQKLAVDASGNASVKVTTLPALAAGSAAIGTVALTAGAAAIGTVALTAGAAAVGTVGVTSLPALVAGAAAIGTVGVTSTVATPAGANMIGSAQISDGTTPAQKLAVDASGLASVSLMDVTATGNITTQNLVPAGAATAGSAVTLTNLSGRSTLQTQVTGTYTGALNLQGTVDGSTWVTIGTATVFVTQSSGAILSAIPSAAVNIYKSDISGYQSVRVSATAGAVTGAAVVSLRASAGVDMVTVQNAVVLGTSANTIGVLATGTNVIGGVTIGPGSATADNLSSAATTNATSVKGSSGNLYSVVASNIGGAAAFVKIYNKATAPTVGTDVPVLTIPIAASGVVAVEFGTIGIRLATGIAFAITNLVADTDTTAVAAAQVKVLISYT